MKISIITLLIGIVLIFTSVSSRADWCTLKAETAQYTYENRDTITKEEALSGIENIWYEAKHAGENVVPWYMLVDVQRFTNDIYRKGRNGSFSHNYDDPKELYEEELYQCMINRY